MCSLTAIFSFPDQLRSQISPTILIFTFLVVPSGLSLTVSYFHPVTTWKMLKLNILAFIASYLFNRVIRSLTFVRQNPSGQITAWT